jgi:hypothetical protein
MANDPKGAKDFQFPGGYGGIHHEIFTAEKVHLYVVDQLSAFPGLAQGASVEFIRAHLDNILARLTTWCVSGRIEDTVTTHKVSYPDGVWQMFKENYLPWWFKEKFPVRMKTVEVRETVNHYFVCPHLVTDSQGKHIQFMAIGTRIAGRMRPDSPYSE